MSSMSKIFWSKKCFGLFAVLLIFIFAPELAKAQLSENAGRLYGSRGDMSRETVPAEQDGKGILISRLGEDGTIRHFTIGEAEHHGKPVRVGYCELPGYQEESEAGVRSGYAYDLLQMMNFYSDWHFSYIGYGKATWEDMLRMLDEGEIDLIPAAERTPEREAQYLFSDVPVGEQREMLVAHKDEYTLEPGKPELYNGLRVGTIRKTLEADAFRRYAAQNGISFTLVEVENGNDLRDALLDGDVDAIVKGSLTVEPHEKLLVELSSKPVYIMMNRQDTTLKKEVDSAIRALNSFFPEWKGTLVERYYGTQGAEALRLLPADRDYLAELKRTRRNFYVAAMPDNAPYSYVENGQVKGIIPDIFRQVADRLGIEYRFMDIPTRKDYEELSGTADILLNKETNYSLAENKGYKLSRQALEVTLAEVRRQDAKGEVKCVAVPRHPELLRNVSEFFPDSVEFVQFETIRECVQAVNERSCDAAYMYFYSAQRIVQESGQDDSFSDMQMHILPDKKLPLSFAVRSSRDYRLGRLLNLALGTVSKVYINKLEASYTALQPMPQTLTSFLRSHPLVVVVLVFGLFLALFAFMRYRLMMQQQGESKALEAYYSDFWIGKHNRNWFEENIQQIAAGYKREQEEGRLAVAVVRLSWGAIFRENYGREAINSSINQLFEALTAEKEFVKAGGVTTSAHKIFLLLLVPPGRELKECMEELLAKNEYTMLKGNRISLNLKAGCVRVEEMPFEPQKLTGWCEVAYDSIRHSMANVAVFGEKQRELMKQQRLIEQYMEKGIAEKEIKVFCQPKYDIRTHKCIGAEALTRWISPELGFLGPGQFIPIFERNGFALAFDFYMLRETCAMQRRRLDEGQTVVPVSVNQSRLHFTEPDYLEKMKSVAAEFHLPPGTIELEITETLFENFDRTAQVNRGVQIMHELHKMGFGLSMDDFGSGYSSLTMVAQLPLDVLKIDRALLLSAEEGERRRTVLESAIALGRKLGMRVICEGIETREQEMLLLNLQCTEGQGFLFAKPMPMEDFERFLEAHCS